MRNFWAEIPMLRLTFWVIAGVVLEIIADRAFHIAGVVLFPVITITILSFALLLTSNLVKNVRFAYTLRMVDGLFISALLVSLSYLLAWLHTDSNYHSHFQNFLQPKNSVVAKIIKPPLEKTKTVNAIAGVEEINNNAYSVATTGKLLVSIIRDSSSLELKYGDVIAFNAPVKEIEGPKNPEEFDYRRYQSFHNIYHRAFLTPGSWHLIKSNEGNGFFSSVYKIRSYFLSLIEKYVSQPNEFAVASAIMLGYSDYMNADVMRAYASSGTLHVLSVSGLHVGIMFLMLNFLLKRMDDRGRRYQIAKAVIIICFIWFYACLTGLSPSVLRSALMFSMIQVGKTYSRNVNVYNIVFGSALVLILFDPFLITEVGFCLSYIAVVGILYLYPKISGLILIKNPKRPVFKGQEGYLKKVLVFVQYDGRWFMHFSRDWLWQLVAVSAAAQIATLPLSLFYFHQIPVLSLLTNLVVIPASNLILFTGTALCALGEIPFLNTITGTVFNGLLTGLNKFIFWVDSLSFALIPGISVTTIELLLLYLALFLFCWLLYKAQSKVLLALLSVVLLLAISYSLKQVERTRQKQFIVYSVPKARAVSIIEGQSVYTCFDDTLLKDNRNMLFHVRPHWWRCGITNEKPATETDLPFGKMLFFEGRKILLIDSDFNYRLAPGQKFKTNYLLISHNPKVKVKQLQKYFDFDEVIFDSSNRKQKITTWATECLNLKVNYRDVSEGAFVLTLD